MKRRFALLPSARSAVTAAASPPTEEGGRRRLDLEVEVHRDGERADAVPLGATLLDAGDIDGLHPSTVALVEPRRGAQGFEPNHFPYVDLVDADLPWRYSLDTSSGHRQQPWLALVALRTSEFRHVEQGSAPLPRIRVEDPSSSLPPIGGLWASAHVHLDLGVDGEGSVDDALQGDPARQLARVLCLRRLRERERYELFLVPTFEAGRRAGLGRGKRPDTWGAPAWTDTAEPVELPVYFRSHFVTSAMEDFELLVRRLRPRPTDGDGPGAVRSASAARPGYYDDQDRPGRTFSVLTAMRPPGTGPPGFDTDEELTGRLATTLTEVITGEVITEDGPDAGDPLVAMPAYGWRFRHETRLDPDFADTSPEPWFDRLNLDLAMRQVAGLGARLVQQHQEELMASAWDQHAELVEANRRLGRLEVAEQLASRLAERRLERLPAEVQLTLEQPLHGVVQVDADRTVGAALAGHGVPRAFGSVELRRLAARRTVRLPGSGGLRRSRVPAPALPGDRDATVERVTRDRVDTDELRGSLAAVSSMFFVQGLQAGPAPRTLPRAVTEFASGELATRAGQVLRRLPAAKAGALVRGRRGGEEAAIAPVLRAPRITTPLADRLAELAPNALLTGVDDLPDDTVTVVEESRAFVEAFLVGANHELNHELRWRQFPTDMRGTALRRFWDRGYPSHDHRGDDTDGIHTWHRPLGRNFPEGDDHEADLVLLFKGGIVRKLGKLVVVLNETDDESWEPGRGTDHLPVFDGSIGGDTSYYGFDVPRTALAEEPERFRFVLHEPQNRLRFGLDIATASTRHERFAPDQASLPFPVQAAVRRPPRARLMPPPAFTGTPRAVGEHPGTWADLSWEHVETGASRYLDVDAAVAVTDRDEPDLWGDERTSASIARSVWQTPVAAVLPVGRVL